MINIAKKEEIPVIKRIKCTVVLVIRNNAYGPRDLEEIAHLFNGIHAPSAEVRVEELEEERELEDGKNNKETKDFRNYRITGI